MNLRAQKPGPSGEVTFTVLKERKAVGAALGIMRRLLKLRWRWETRYELAGLLKIRASVLLYNGDRLRPRYIAFAFPQELVPNIRWENLARGCRA